MKDIVLLNNIEEENGGFWECCQISNAGSRLTKLMVGILSLKKRSQNPIYC